MHPSYDGPECQVSIDPSCLQEQRKRLIDKEEIAYASEKIGMEIEWMSQSDTTSAWESSAVSKDSMPSDAHIQAVMLSKSSGYSDISGRILDSLHEKLVSGVTGDDGEPVLQQKITVHNIPVNEFTENHLSLSCAFKFLFLMRVTEDELGIH